MVMGDNYPNDKGKIQQTHRNVIVSGFAVTLALHEAIRRK